VFVSTILGIDLGDDPEVKAALIAASSAIVLAGIGRIAGYISGKRERQRDLYSQAFKAAMSWREMVYRVRRRAEGDEPERVLIDRFHELQEELDYYQGWIASESPWMGRSYCRLVEEVKQKCADDINKAWDEPERRRPASGTLDNDNHPDCRADSDRFLFDVRSHLSMWVLPKLLVAWRNRKCFGGRG
jgi:hypothetical protein